MASQEKVAEKPIGKKRTKRAVYASDADRARAWRQRQKALIESLHVPPAPPVIIEKIVLRDPVVPPLERTRRARKVVESAPRVEPFQTILAQRFSGFQGEAEAKRFRTNATKAATFARELLNLGSTISSQIPDTERTFLQEAATFFDRFSRLCEGAQAAAKRATAQAEDDFKRDREARLLATIERTLGRQPDAWAILKMGADLLEFEAQGASWLSQKYGVKASVFLHRIYELRAAVHAGDPVRVAREVAEARIEIGEKGRRWLRDNGEPALAAG